MVADFLPIQKMQSMPPLSPLPPGLPTWPELPPPLPLLRELSLNLSSAGKNANICGEGVSRVAELRRRRQTKPNVQKEEVLEKSFFKVRK